MTVPEAFFIFIMFGMFAAVAPRDPGNWRLYGVHLIVCAVATAVLYLFIALTLGVGDFIRSLW